LDQVCRATNTRYLHCLQPNQHVEGSKRFTKEELEIALGMGSPYQQAAADGYPYLIRAGQQLRDAGVDFHDLTLLFADNTEILYSDTCCHFNQRGYDLLAEALAERILEEPRTK
jgi:hypothetical protein